MGPRARLKMNPRLEFREPNVVIPSSAAKLMPVILPLISALVLVRVAGRTPIPIFVLPKQLSPRVMHRLTRPAPGA